MRGMILMGFSIFLLILVGCSSETTIVVDPEKEDPNQDNPPNILLVIADDMGLDATPGYAIGDQKPNMPYLTSMIESGLRFTNMWSAPLCTPTRSTILTGKYGFRTNVLQVGDELSISEMSIHRYLSESNLSYEQALIGKWHLSNDPNHPNNIGIDYYAGSLGGGLRSYSNWSLTINGETTTSRNYNTTALTDLAIDWVSDQTEPWFLWLAYNAPHTPFHLPPSNLHFQGDLPSDEASIDQNPLPYYLAMIEAMDTEMGRLLESLPADVRENTVVIFIGDNGTPNQVAQEYRSNRVKGTLYQGGINVPMIVSGKGVTRSNETEDALLNTTDLFATIAEIAGSADSEIHDSRSFKSLLSSTGSMEREYVFSQIGTGQSSVEETIRDNQYKYIVFDNGTEALYDLLGNSLENPNLLNTNRAPITTADSIRRIQLINKIIEIKG